MNPPPGILDFVLSFVERRNKLTSNTYVKYDVIFSYLVILVTVLVSNCSYVEGNAQWFVISNKTKNNDIIETEV